VTGDRILLNRDLPVGQLNIFLLTLAIGQCGKYEDSYQKKDNKSFTTGNSLQ
jgi:hypothetical protein